MGLFNFNFGKKQEKEKIKDEKDQPSKSALLAPTEVISGLSLPFALANQWDKILKTQKTYIKIVAAANGYFSLKDSKFGHYPVLPAGFEYPRDEHGLFMFPLAQINCSEYPDLAGFPGSGYIQFYISAFDEVYGLDFDHPQSQINFRVLYFEEEEVKNHIEDFSFLNEVMDAPMTPISSPYRLNFSLQNEYMGIGDVNFEAGDFQISDLTEKYPAIESVLEDCIYETFVSNGHKIGGYAYFVQSDPRIYHPEFKDYILLLQIDTDQDIMWGDAGVGNFFIHPDDLLKKDFSRVVYNWDCG